MKNLTKAPVVLIIPYFGKFGAWFPLFLRSVGQQRTLDLLLLTDAPTPALPDNVRCIDMTLGRVRSLSEEKLKTSVSLFNVRKLCDLKPFYGMIFEDYIRDYRYWAFGDEDVLFGDLDRLIAPRLKGEPDLVVPGNGMVIGHLTLLRNTPRINALYRRDPEYWKVLSDSSHWAYDETSWAHSEECGSFTKTVKAAEKAGEICINWGLAKRGDVPWPGRFVTYNGRALHDTFGCEVAYYHWGRLRLQSWKFPTPAEAGEGFSVDALGFHDSPPSRLRRRARQVLTHGRAAAGKMRRLVRQVMQRP